MTFLMHSLLCALLLAALNVPSAFAEDDDALVCQGDSDCVLLEGVCPGEWVAVNQAHEEQERARIARTAPMVECAQAQAPMEQPSVFCAKEQDIRRCRQVR